MKLQREKNNGVLYEDNLSHMFYLENIFDNKILKILILGFY